MEATKKDEQWNSTLLSSLGCGLLLAVLISYFFYELEGAIVTGIAFLCLALGLWITQLLTRAFTGVKKQSPAVLVLLFTGKLLWWASLFILSKKITPAQQWPVMIGFLFFLIAITLAGVLHYGFPGKSSESKLGDS
jgi:hypothetical protein